MKKNPFRQYLAPFIIFSNMFVFFSQAIAIPYVDEQRLYDLFGEDISTHVMQNAKEVSLTRGASGAYSLNFDDSQDQEIIKFHDTGKSVGIWIKNQGHGFFIGSKEIDSDFDIQSILNLSSLQMEVSGHLRFLQGVTLKETANLASRFLTIDGIFSSQGSSKFSVQERMEVFGNLTSSQRIIGNFKSFFSRGSVIATDDLFLEGEEIANNGRLEGTEKLILQATNVINRAHLKANTLLIDVKKELKNISGSLIDAKNQLKTTYAIFNNTGSIKVEKDFFSQGEKFENKRSNSSCGTLDIGGLYQANVHTYVDSGMNTWNGMALIHTEIADLGGQYRCSSASMTAEKSIVARGGSSFEVNHFLELKSEDGTLDFGGALFLTSTVKKAAFSRNSPLSLLVDKMPHLISMDGCKKLTQRGRVISTSSSINYSSDGKFDFTGKSRSGFSTENTTRVRAQHAQLNGILQSSGDVILSIKNDLQISGEVSGRNLKAMVQNLFVSGSLRTIENAALQVDHMAEVVSTGSLQIGKTLALISDSDVTFAGAVHAEQSVVQADTITNTGSFSVDTLAHFKADTYFSNLWGGCVEAKDIQVDAALSLNLLSQLSATRSLTTNALVDLNLLGRKTAHHITTSALFSFDVGLSLPSLHPSDLLSFESLIKGLKAAALSFSPADVRSVLNLGFLAYNFCQQITKLYKEYYSLEDKARFSDFIPLIVGIKDLGLSAYTIYTIAKRKDKEVEKTHKTDIQSADSSALFSKENLKAAAASVLMPSITQDSLFGINVGLMVSGNVYQRGLMSINTGVIGVSEYTNDSLYAYNEGHVVSHKIQYENTNFHNGGTLISVKGDVRVTATQNATNTGVMNSVGNGSRTILTGKTVLNAGKVSSDGAAVVQGVTRAINQGNIEGKKLAQLEATEGHAENQKSGNIHASEKDSVACVKGKTVLNAGTVSSDGAAVVQGITRAINQGNIEGKKLAQLEATEGHAENQKSGNIHASEKDSVACVKGKTALNAGTVSSDGSHNYSLTPAAKFVIFAVVTYATCGVSEVLFFGGSFIASSYPALLVMADSLFAGVLIQSITAGINLTLGDKHWKDDLSVKNLLIGTISAGVLLKVGLVSIKYVKSFYPTKNPVLLLPYHPTIRNTSGTAFSSTSLCNPEKIMKKGILGRIPEYIGRNMEGKSYKTFDVFRKDFWKNIANSRYAEEFGKHNINRMKNGYAPYVPSGQNLGKLNTYQLHHKIPLNQGGYTYDLSNIVIVTPKYHPTILSKNIHYGIANRNFRR